MTYLKVILTQAQLPYFEVILPCYSKRQDSQLSPIKEDMLYCLQVTQDDWNNSIG